MNRMEIIVFFDESGKRDKPALMGALAIPRTVYKRSDIQTLLPSITETKIHWTQYNGDSKERRLITKIINRLSSYESMVRFNVINYNHSILEQLEDQRELPKGMAEMTICPKANQKEKKSSSPSSCFKIPSSTNYSPTLRILNGRTRYT